MAALTLREAARQVGVSRQTIYRLVKEGKLTSTVAHDGGKVVDTSELLRVFGRLAPDKSETVTRQAVVLQPATPHDRPHETARPGLQAMSAADVSREVAAADRAALQAELAAARDALRKAEEQLQEAREREAKLMELAQSATRLLEHREAQANPPKGFWRRVFGG